MFQVRANARRRLCACAGCCEYTNLAHAKKHLFAWCGPNNCCSIYFITAIPMKTIQDGIISCKLLCFWHLSECQIFPWALLRCYLANFCHGDVTKDEVEDPYADRTCVCNFELHQREVRVRFCANKAGLTLLLLNTTCPILANSVDPDQLASEEANWSGSALFVIKYVNF